MWLRIYVYSIYDCKLSQKLYKTLQSNPSFNIAFLVNHTPGIKDYVGHVIWFRLHFASIPSVGIAQHEMTPSSKSILHISHIEFGARYISWLMHKVVISWCAFFHRLHLSVFGMVALWHLSAIEGHMGPGLLKIMLKALVVDMTF